jgi:hypothetical protein
LQKIILENSAADGWEEARVEWTIEPRALDLGEDSFRDAHVSCICGYEPLRYLFTAVNTVTGVDLRPIGSQCIGEIDVLLKRRAEHMRRVMGTALDRRRQDRLDAALAADRRAVDEAEALVRDRAADLDEIQHVADLYDLVTVRHPDLFWSGRALDDMMAVLSPSVIRRLADVGALPPSRYNYNDPGRDADFLIQTGRQVVAFGHDCLTDAQQNKAGVLSGEIARWCWQQTARALNEGRPAPRMTWAARAVAQRFTLIDLRDCLAALRARTDRRAAELTAAIKREDSADYPVRTTFEGEVLGHLETGVSPDLDADDQTEDIDELSGEDPEQGL